MSQFYALHLYLDAASKVTLPVILGLSLSVITAITYWLLDRKDKNFISIIDLLFLITFELILIIGMPHLISNHIVKPMISNINGSSVVLLNRVDSITNKNSPIINNTMIVYSAESSSIAVKSKFNDKFNGQSAKFTITKNEIIPENEYAEFMLKSEEELAKLNLDIDESSITQISNYKITAMTKDGQNVIISPTSYIKNENNTIYINVNK